MTLVFDNTRRFFDVAYDEVVITRRLHRQNNEAEYLINKTPCRLKDITDLVMDTGLGRDSLSIITQGNISSFAEAKPEERRALFEEAAGVAKYKKRKNTSLSKLKNTQENLSRLEDIILELERQVNPLRRQAKQADQYLKYKEELSRIEINVIVDEIERLNTQIAEMEKERFELDSRCAMQQTTIQVQDVENEEQRKEMYALDREINQLQGEYSRAMDESARLERRKVELDEKRKYALEHANAKERARELRGMLEEAKFEYEDRRKRNADGAGKRAGAVSAPAEPPGCAEEPDEGAVYASAGRALRHEREGEPAGHRGRGQRAARRDGELLERDHQCAGRRHVSYRVCR